MKELQTLRRQTVQGILESPVLQSMQNGRLDSGYYSRYLLNVWHYALHSSKVISLAGSRLVNSHPQLASYLFHHAEEEMGHDEWVLDDLIALGWTRDQVARTRATPSCAAMVGYEYYLAGTANAASIFGWLFILEAMGDDLGKDIASKLTSIPEFEGAVKFIEGHGEADVAHTQDLTRMIETHISGQDYEDVVHVAEVIKHLYVSMFHELKPELAPA